jgi:hypothetical protein
MYFLRTFARALVCALLLAPTSSLAQYKYPKDDLVVVLNGLLFNMIDHLAGTSYEGFYHNNGTVCTTPLLSAALSRFSDTRTSEYNLLAGDLKTTVSLAAWIKAEASQCISSTIKVEAGCKTPPLQLIGPPRSEFAAFLYCDFQVNNFFFIALPVPVRLPYPIQVPSSFDISLPTSPSNTNPTIDLEFATYDTAASAWKPLPAPEDRTRHWPLSGDIAFLNDAPTDASRPQDITYKQGMYIAGKATATHPRIIVDTNDQQKALSEGTGLDDFFKNNPNAMARIRIRESLLAPQSINSPTDPRYGLIGGLFPLIVKGTFKPPGSPGQTINYRIVISSVTASISARGNTPVFHANIAVEDISATDASGKPLRAKLAKKPSISLGLSSAVNTGALRLEISSLEASLHVQAGRKTALIPLGSNLRDILNAKLPSLGSVAPSITLGLPQCIDMHNIRFDALSRCVDHGNATTGYMSKGGGPPAVTYSIDFRKTKIDAVPGEVAIGFQR